jgi:hypothetical protein
MRIRCKCKPPVLTTKRIVIKPFKYAELLGIKEHIRFVTKCKCGQLYEAKE